MKIYLTLSELFAVAEKINHHHKRTISYAFRVRLIIQSASSFALIHVNFHFFFPATAMRIVCLVSAFVIEHIYPHETHRHRHFNTIFCYFIISMAQFTFMTCNSHASSSLLLLFYVSFIQFSHTHVWMWYELPLMGNLMILFIRSMFIVSFVSEWKKWKLIFNFLIKMRTFFGENLKEIEAHLMISGTDGKRLKWTDG
jgi:hypothetical protein